MTTDEVSDACPTSTSCTSANPAIYGPVAARAAARPRAGPVRLHRLPARMVERASVTGQCLLVGHSSINRVLLAAVLGVPPGRLPASLLPGLGQPDRAALARPRDQRPAARCSSTTWRTARGISRRHLGLRFDVDRTQVSRRDLTLEDVWAGRHDGHVRRSLGGRRAPADAGQPRRDRGAGRVRPDRLRRDDRLRRSRLASASRAADSERSRRTCSISHAVGVGRAARPRTSCAPCCCCAPMRWRAATAAAARSSSSGCSTSCASDIHPVVPEQGSVGASGDLAPLAHLALPLIGRGRAEVDGEVVDGAEALAPRGLAPLALRGQGGPRAAQRHAADDGHRRARAAARGAAVRTASVVAAMSVEALMGTDVAFADAYQQTRPHPGQVARRRRAAPPAARLGADASRITATRTRSRTRTRSAACRRSTARSSDALAYVRRVLEIEINSATDNPLVFPDGADVDPSRGRDRRRAGRLGRQLPRRADRAGDGLR